MADFDFDLVETSLLEEESKLRKNVGLTGKAPIGWSAHRSPVTRPPAKIADRAAGAGAASPSIPFVLDEGLFWVQKRKGTCYAVIQTEADNMCFTK
mmetsp:Transcript_87421/g.195479  ORF Transcript_87421/g.195479 Transcript_87421/m.195479 type:complete len:96 (-) Transcript_87421:37-324(-)